MKAIETLSVGRWLEDIATPIKQRAVEKQFPGVDIARETLGFRLGGTLAIHGACHSLGKDFSKKFASETALTPYPDLVIEDAIQPKGLKIWQPHIMKLIIQTYQVHTEHHTHIDQWAAVIAGGTSGEMRPSETLGIKLGYTFMLDIAK